METFESLYLRDNAYSQAKSLLKNIATKIDIFDEESLISIVKSQEVKTELELIANNYCQYGVTNNFLRIFVPIFRLGVRIGALYEIENHKKSV